jgi:hypothetical protein
VEVTCFGAPPYPTATNRNRAHRQPNESTDRRATKSSTSSRGTKAAESAPSLVARVPGLHCGERQGHAVVGAR